MKTAIIMYALIAGIVFVIAMAALVATVGAVEVITMEYPEDAGCGCIVLADCPDRACDRGDN